MYQRVNKSAFTEAFRTMGRYDHQDGQGGNFTYEALVALFDYLGEYEESAGGDAGIELDVIGLCCEFAEYDNIEELASEYDNDFDVNGLLHALEHAQEDGKDDLRNSLTEWFRDQTTVIEIPGTDRIIIQQF